MKRYAIYGAGSLGTVLGAYITKNGGKIIDVSEHNGTITWKKTARAEDYQVYRSLKKSGGYELIATVSKSKRSYTDKELTKGTRYYYKVRGERHFSGTVRRGAFSKVKSAVAK